MDRYLCQSGDDARVGLLAVRVHARTVHGPAEAQHEVVLGHAVLVLVDLRKTSDTRMSSMRCSLCPHMHMQSTDDREIVI